MSDKPDHEQEVREARETVRFVMRRKYAPDLKECQELLDRFEAAVRAKALEDVGRAMEGWEIPFPFIKIFDRMRSGG